jgi:hypothetical protein
MKREGREYSHVSASFAWGMLTIEVSRDLFIG